MRNLLIIILLISVSPSSVARHHVEEHSISDDMDTLSYMSTQYHWALEGGCTPGRVLSLDKQLKSTLKACSTTSLYLQANRVADYKHGTDFDVDYNYPTLAIGLRLNLNHGTRFHRDENMVLENMEGVDYVTQMGNALTLYGRFERPLYRKRRWEAGYYLGLGAGFFHKKYNRIDGIDNELIGAKTTIYFTAGLYGQYWLSQDLAFKAGVDFAHHSTGALSRPNKGANYLGPFAAISYSPKHEFLDQSAWKSLQALFSPYWFMELTAGVGGKSLLEDWKRTQIELSPSDPDYRTSHFPVYGTLSIEAALLYRYARRWASGVGMDVFYGSYASKVSRLDRGAGFMDERHSPWSIGIAFRHEVFYGPFSARMGLGWYLYRHMGVDANKTEKPYYARIGLFYTPKRLGGTAFGMSVNAHLGKADFTELVVSVPVIRFKKW